MTKATLDAMQAVQNVTLTAKMKNERVFALRVWVAVRLIALAAWLMNCPVEFE